MKPEPRISLIQTNYQGRLNLERYLPLTLETVENSPLIGEVLIADDASTDGSVQFLAERFPSVRVVALPQNRGFGATANAAFEAARFPYVLNISSDMVLEAGAAEALMAGFVRPDIFSVSVRLMRPDGRLDKGRAVPMFWTGDLKMWRAASELAGEAPPPGGWLQHFSGAIGLFDRRAFLELGGFDDLFLPFFAEETDLCYRAWKRGYRILYQPAAVVTHHHEESGTIKNNFSRQARTLQFKKNRLLFVWKNIHDPAFVVLHGVNLVARTALSWLFLDFGYYKALARALKSWPEALAGRRREQLAATRSDREVFREFRATLYP